MRYMITHKDDFVPFMDRDREPFDMVGVNGAADGEYVRRMLNNCTWGGDLEINAISNCYKCNVIVYQDRRPNIELQTFPDRDRVMRLAYFGSCHYESVRGHNYKSLSAESTPGTVVLRSDSVKRREMNGDGEVKTGSEKKIVGSEKKIMGNGEVKMDNKKKMMDSKESNGNKKDVAPINNRKEETNKQPQQKASFAAMEVNKNPASHTTRPLSKKEIAERN